MEKQDYNCVINANVSTKDAFDGISDVQLWWATNFEGNSQRINDVFTVHFGETFGTFRIIELIPYKKIVWLCEDCYLDLLKDKKEWKGNKIVWEISAKKDTAEISMTHWGLVPGIECYSDCIKGWDFYLKESLHGFLTRQKGAPGIGIMATISNGDRTYKGTLFSRNDPAPDFAEGYLVIDVKATMVEHVTAIHSVEKYYMENFNPQQIKGDHFMIVENKPVTDNMLPFDDLKHTIR